MEKEMADSYRVRSLKKTVQWTVAVPGSKSITNRALLLSALCKGHVCLHGVLFSDDSRHFLDCLVTLGYKLDINETEKTVKLQGCGRNIPNKFAKINVGSAGTAARFITAMLALSDGGYEIGCSEQMEKRPMEELFKVLTDMGAQFTYLKEEGHLPVRVKGNGGICKDINMDISKSTQFLSAMLMVTPVTDSGICIRITSEKKEGSYIHITMKMLQSFGVDVKFDGECYTVPGKQKLQIGTYYIEPDVSAACYFYGMAALTGGKVIVKNVHSDSMQGDLKFLSVLEKMGCEKTEEQDGIAIQGPQDVKLKGVDINMNDFSDQALTLAALAPFADSETVIRNIGHIRGQECNRMAAIVNELKKCGIGCWEDGDDIHIEPGEIAPAVIETYEDHRVAMAFTLLGLKANGIVISNPMCCKKTFETYYKVLEQFIAGESKSE